MTASLYRPQTSAGESTGRAFLFGDRGLRQALVVDKAQGGARVCSVFQQAARSAVVARTGLIAIGSVHFIPIALPRSQPAGIECSRGTVLPAGWRSVVRSLPRRIAEISCRAITRRDAAIPLRINARPEKPIVEPSHRRSLSCVRRLNDRDRDTKGFLVVRTAFQEDRNVFRG